MQTLLLGFFSPRFLAGCHHQTAHRKYAQVEKKILQQGFQSGGLISSSCAGHSLNLSSQGGKSSNFYVSTVASRAVGTYPVSVLDAANLSMPQTQLLVFIANSWACPASLWAPHKLWNPVCLPPYQHLSQFPNDICICGFCSVPWRRAGSASTDAAFLSQMQRVQLASSPPSPALQPIRGSDTFTELLGRAAELQKSQSSAELCRDTKSERIKHCHCWNNTQSIKLGFREQRYLH